MQTNNKTRTRKYMKLADGGTTVAGGRRKRLDHPSPSRTRTWNVKRHLRDFFGSNVGVAGNPWPPKISVLLIPQPTGRF